VITAINVVGADFGASTVATTDEGRAESSALIPDKQGALIDQHGM
jgi:hypothetical protein